MTASQDYRDGSATGAAQVARRAWKLASWGIRLSPAIINAPAEGVAEEMGGTVGEDYDRPA